MLLLSKVGWVSWLVVGLSVVDGVFVPHLNIVYNLQAFFCFFVFPMSDESFAVVVHHRCHFAKNEWCKYVGGETTHWSCDPDRWSYFKIFGSLKEMGYHSIKGLCCVEMLLHPLDDDRGALNMLHITRHYGEVHMFVMHGVDEVPVEDNIVEPEGDAGRPLESGESSHAVSEFEVLETKIVVRSAPREDVRSAPHEDVINQETEIGSDEGEVVDSLRRSASSAPKIVVMLWVKVLGIWKKR